MMIDLLDSEKLFAKVEQLKNSRNWTVYELAKRSGVSANAIRNWQERKTLPSLTVLANICQAFEISIIEFLEAEEEYEKLTKESKELFQTVNSLSKEQKVSLRNFLLTMKYQK